MYYKLSTYAKKFSVTYRTAWNHYKAGKIDGAFLDKNGHVLIPIESFKENKTKRVALYARVSSNDMKDELDKQLERVKNYSITNGYNIVYEFKEIASGMNDHRTKLCKLLKKEDYDIIVVENKDRLTRFGFNYIETLLKTKGKEILVINDTLNDEKKDLINDLVSIIYSFSARIYGLRKGREKSQELKKIINEN